MLSVIHALWFQLHPPSLLGIDGRFAANTSQKHDAFDRDNRQVLRYSSFLFIQLGAFFKTAYAERKKPSRFGRRPIFLNRIAGLGPFFFDL